jgi:hypothetical protein
VAPSNSDHDEPPYPLIQLIHHPDPITTRAQRNEYRCIAALFDYRTNYGFRYKSCNMLEHSMITNTKAFTGIPAIFVPAVFLLPRGTESVISVMSAAAWAIRGLSRVVCCVCWSRLSVDV